MNDRSKRNIGPLLVCLSSVCFAIGGLCIKYIPWNALSINAARNLIAVLIVFLYLKLTGHRIVLNQPVLIGALAITGTNVLYTLANKLTTAGNAIILEYTSPIFVMLASALLYGKKPSKTDIMAVICVFAGVVCFFIDGISAGNMPGNILALLSGVFNSGVFLMNESKDSDPISSVFFGMLFNVAIGLPWLMRENFAATGITGWLAVAALGVFQLGTAYILLTEGLKTTPAISACLINGLEPVLNPLLVAVIYGELLTPLSFAGAGIVFVSVLIYNILNAHSRE